MSCLCPKPIQSLNTSRYGDMCLKCAKRIVGDWVADDDTMGEFYDRLSEAMSYGLDLAPDHPFEFFRRQCLNRERAGRTHPKGAFGYLDRNNASEGKEEAADGANYAAFEEMKQRRKGEAPSTWLLVAAVKAAEMHEAFMRYEQEQRGVPQAISDQQAA